MSLNRKYDKKLRDEAVEHITDFTVNTISDLSWEEDIEIFEQAVELVRYVLKKERVKIYERIRKRLKEQAAGQDVLGEMPDELK